MPDLDNIHNLMQAASELLDVAEVTENLETQTWCFVVDEEAVVHVEFDEGCDRLVLTADLGPIHEDRRFEVMTTMLSYNLLWRSTGARMAMDPETCEAELLFDLAASRLDASRFCTAFGNFVSVAADWRQLVQASTTEEANGSDRLPDMGAALRV